LPEPLLLELVLALVLVVLALVAAAFDPVLVLELDDDPHAASNSATAARPATLAVLPRESNPAVILMCGAPSSASSAAVPPTYPVPSHMSTGAWRGNKQ
jgi:hypothetical protein